MHLRIHLIVQNNGRMSLSFAAQLTMKMPFNRRQIALLFRGGELFRLQPAKQPDKLRKVVPATHSPK